MAYLRKDTEVAKILEVAFAISLKSSGFHASKERSI
jgi:hypothetical protein